MSTVEITRETRRGFFTVGGTLPANAPSYVERKADADLFAHLMEGQFCYVLTSRQVGKSSLMVRTAVRLRQAGRRIAVLDLTKIGMNLSAEQWYDGLLVQLGREFNLENELDGFWTGSDAAVRRMGPMQRWMTALRQVILPSVAGNLVIFVDEIDAVRGLPFATDEFFAGIRQVYNDRTADPELNRLTFCLIGVATPADLIRNVSTTPFNIGNRVVLTDFTEREAEPLIHGLGREPVSGFVLLRRILWWTNGHPYLTQRLCAAVAADPGVISSADVDRVCNDLFLSARARESDDNLLFVRERILRRRDDAELSGLLDLYGLIRSGKQVSCDDNNPLIDILRLAGLAAMQDNRLVVRNRIYNHVFDHRWIRTNMPDAELRRQHVAYRKGMLRAAGLAALVLLVIAGLVLANLGSRQQVAIRNYAIQVVQVQQAFDNGDYASGVEEMRETQHLVRSQEHWLVQLMEGSPLLPFVLEHPYLYALANRFDQRVDARFEWNYLRARLFGDGAFFYMGNRNEIRSVAISPNGRWLATGSADSTVRIFDISGFSADSRDHPHLDCALAVLNRPDSSSDPGSYLYLPRENDDNWSVNQALDSELKRRHWVLPTQAVADGQGRTVPAQSLSDRELAERGLTLWHPPGVLSVAFSPDNSWIAIGTGTWNAPEIAGTVYLWRTASLCSGSPRILRVPTQHTKAIDAVFFRNRGDEFATTSEDDTAEFWRILPGNQLEYESLIDARDTTTKGMNAGAFSPDGRTFAMVFGDGHFCTSAVSSSGKAGGCWNPVVADVSGLMSVAYYDNGLIMLGTRDGRVVRADLKDNSWQFSTFLETGQGLVTSLTVSGDKSLLLTTGSDGTVLVWNLVRDRHPDVHNEKELLGYGASQMLRGAKSVVYSAAMTADQRLIVSGGSDNTNGSSDGRVYFWTRQPRPDGELSNPAPSTQSDAPSVKVECAGRQIERSIDPTWSSQPAFLRACGAVQAVAYSPSGREIAGIVGVMRGENLGLAEKDGDPPATVFIEELGQSASDTETVDPVTHQPMKYPEKPVGPPLLLSGNRTNGVGVAWSPDGTLLAAAENDKSGFCGTVQLWRIGGPAPVPIAPPLPAELAPGCDLAAEWSTTIQSIAFLNDGTLIAGLNQTNKVHSRATMVLWNPMQSKNFSRQPVANPGFDHPRNISFASLGFGTYGNNFTLNALAFSADDHWMAVCGNRNSIQIWNITPGLKSLTLDKNLNGTEYSSPHNPPGGLQGQCSAVAFSPDSRWIAAGTRSYEMALWSAGDWVRMEGRKVTSSLVETGQDNHTSSPSYYTSSPPMANAAINAIVFSPDNRRLAYGTADSKISLWHMIAQTPLPSVNIHSGGVLSLAFSPNGVCLASGSSDQTLRFSCEVDPAYLVKIQRINLQAQDRPESQNWIQFAQ